MDRYKTEEWEVVQGPLDIVNMPCLVHDNPPLSDRYNTDKYLATYHFFLTFSQRYDAEDRLGTPGRLVTWMNAQVGDAHAPIVSIHIKNKYSIYKITYGTP